MKKMMTGALMLLAGAFLLLPAGNADAHMGHGKRGKWGKRGKRGCGGMLMRAGSWKLKKAGLNDTQVTQLKSIRTSYKKTTIPLRSKIKLIRVDLRNLMDNPNVDQAKVLTLVSQINELKGKIKLLRVKTRLQIRALLTPEQRQKMRKMCRRKMRRFRRFRKFGHHGGFYRRGYGKRGHGKWGKKGDLTPGSMPSEKQAL